MREPRQDAGSGAASGAREPGAPAAAPGKATLASHEVAHGIDRSVNQSGTPELQAARTADRARLPANESQAGTAGLEETYAESFARFHARDPNDARTYPRLHAYWAADPLARLVRP